MKNIIRLLWLAYGLFPATGLAQDVTAPNSDTMEHPVGIVGTASDSGLYLIGKPFGPSGQWTFGIDKSPTAGACTQREINDGQWLAGPCRDIFILQRHLIPMWHLGAAVMYNAEHGNPSYDVRLGANIGQYSKWCLQKLRSYVPYAEEHLWFQLPGWALYIDHITTVDYSVGYRPNHTSDVKYDWTQGPMVKVDIPLDDLYKLFLIF